MFVSTYTWDGGRESRSLNDLMDGIGDKLAIDPKRLRGW